MTLRDELQELIPHARLPEFVDVIRKTMLRLVIRLRLKEGCDLVGHVDEFVR